MQWNFVYAFMICSICFITNICAICILCTMKKLRKSRFHFLVLFLSISDSCIALQFIIHSVINYINTGTDGYLYGCMILKHSIGGTIGFSEIQTLLICFERLHATFNREVKTLKKITSNASVVISFLLCQLYTFIPLIIEVSYGPQPCTVAYTTRRLYVLTLDVPLLFSAVTIVFVYSIVICRIKRRKILVVNSMTSAEIIKKKNAMMRMKVNIITIGIIITVTFISVFPREIIAIYCTFSEQTEFVLNLVLVGNYLTLLNPLIDPIIYIARFKEVRDMVRCKRFVTPATTIQVLPTSSVRTSEHCAFYRPSSSNV